jgi:hypothetical protein
MLQFLLSFITTIAMSLTLSGEAFNAVEQAFNREDAAKVISYGKEKVIMQIQGKEGVYAQAQATQLLKEFFTRKPVTSFRFTFRGKETDEMPLTTGTYTSKSETFRVTLKWKRINSDLKIESLSIE